MKKALGRTAKKMAPGLLDNIARIEEIDKRLADVQAELARLSQNDFHFNRLKQLAGQVEPYQPAYGIQGVIPGPLRSSIERAHAIENRLQPVAGKRILDIGSSLGYFSFYFSDRGAGVEAWDNNPLNVEVSRGIGEINGLSVNFLVKEFDADSVQTIPHSQFDVALVLSVFHHIIRFKGLDYTQQLVQELLSRVPVLIVELAKKGEDPKLPWDKSQPKNELDIFKLVDGQVSIKKIGEFTNHLSKKKRPLYLVENKKILRVNAHTYAYARVAKEAYKHSPIAHSAIGRRYYFGDDFVIKEYQLDAGSRRENLGQILNEVKVLSDIKEHGAKLYHAPNLLDFDINYPVNAKIALERTEGQLASDLVVPLKPAAAVKVIKDVLKTLMDLEKMGLHHNDVRSWNIIVSPAGGGWLIDYGWVSPAVHDDDVAGLLWSLHCILTGEREMPDQQKTTLPPSEAFNVSSKLQNLYDAVAAGERSLKKLYRTL